MRKFRLFGLVFLAATAVSGIAAASAFATYDSEAATTTLTGTQKTLNEFHTVSGTVKCEVAKFSGTQTGTEVEKGVFTAPKITVHPTYEKCKAFGLSATVTTTGCNYVFTTATTNEGRLDAKVDIECEAGKEIVVNAGFGSCITKVGAQEGLDHVNFTNEGTGTGRSVLVTSEVSGIKYSQEGSTCTGGKQTREDGTYSGTVSTTGSSGGNPVGIWVTSPKP